MLINTMEANEMTYGYFRSFPCTVSCLMGLFSSLVATSILSFVSFGISTIKLNSLLLVCNGMLCQGEIYNLITMIIWMTWNYHTIYKNSKNIDFYQNEICKFTCQNLNVQEFPKAFGESSWKFNKQHILSSQLHAGRSWLTWV